MTMVTMELDRELNDLAERELRRDPTGSGPPPPSSPNLAPRPQIIDQATDDKNIATAVHVGTIAAALSTGGMLDIVVPAVSYVALKDRSAFLREHLRQQLNFQLTLALVTVVGVVLSVVTFGIGAIVAVPAILFFFVADIVCSIKAALASSRGEHYGFPFTIDFIK
jgi:hypothetical protein